jgi:DNA gyrase subunit B
VKRGKQEQYVKDDAELNALLLNAAIEDSALHVQADAPPLRGAGLEMLARQYMEVQAIITRWSRRYDARLLEQLVYIPELKAAEFNNPGTLRDWAAGLERALNSLSDAARSYRISVREAEPVRTEGAEGEALVAPVSRGARVHVARLEHGSVSEKLLPREFFASAEYSRIAELGRTLNGLIGEGAYVLSGNQRHEIGSFKEAMRWLFEQAKKGQSIQRYKGLGEMNPDQLWDTTINPETRRLLQVRIEDAVAADDIFTTLMGEQVEPRREFIEKNALSVSNLDV